MVLPVPGGPEKSALSPLPSDSLRPKPQRAEDDVPMFGLIADLAQLLELVLRQDDVVPAVAGLDLARHLGELEARLGPAGGGEIVGGNPPVVGRSPPSQAGGERDGVANLSGRQLETAGECADIDVSVESAALQPLLPYAARHARVRRVERDVHESVQALERAGRAPGPLGEEKRHPRERLDRCDNPAELPARRALALLFGEEAVEAVDAEGGRLKDCLSRHQPGRLLERPWIREHLFGVGFNQRKAEIGADRPSERLLFRPISALQIDHEACGLGSIEAFTDRLGKPAAQVIAYEANPRGRARRDQLGEVLHGGGDGPRAEQESGDSVVELEGTRKEW